MGLPITRMAAAIMSSSGSQPTGILRAASPFNRIATKVQAGSAAYAPRFAFRYAHIIGSGDHSELRLLFQNWYGAVSGTSNPGNAVTYSNIYLESLALGVSVADKDVAVWPKIPLSTSDKL